MTEISAPSLWFFSLNDIFEKYRKNEKQNMKVKNLSCGFSYLCREKNGSSCIFGFHSILKWTSKKSPPTYAQEMKTFPLLVPRWHHSSFCKTSNLKKEFADVWIGWSLIQRVLKCLWRACQCLQWVLDQAPWDTRKQISKGNYFPLLCPPCSHSHREHSSLTIFTEAPETACTVLESQMIEGTGFCPLIHFQ